MRPLVSLFVLSAVALASVPAVDAGLPFFGRRDSDDRRQRSETRPDREQRLAPGPRLLPRIDGLTAGVFVQVPPAPAGDPPLPPLAAQPEPGSQPVYPLEPLPSSAPIEVYRRVEYDDRDDAHPRGVKRLIAVRDPRSCRRACDCCDSRVVFVEICVPPHCEPRVKVSKDGRKIDLDYGEYEIEIESEDDEIEVEYED
jgi:hypothetical protein